MGQVKLRRQLQWRTVSARYVGAVRSLVSGVAVTTVVPRVTLGRLVDTARVTTRELVWAARRKRCKQHGATT